MTLAEAVHAQDMTINRSLQIAESLHADSNDWQKPAGTGHGDTSRSPVAKQRSIERQQARRMKGGRL